MKPVEPILTVELLPELSKELIALLSSISPSDWSKPTTCFPWTVHDVATHLLGGNLGRLYSSRFEIIQSSPQQQNLKALFELKGQLSQSNIPITDYSNLVKLIDQQNAAWYEAAKDISQEQLIEGLVETDELVYQLFKARPSYDLAPIAVVWAGETQSQNWFDIAREYTEKWHHQQHIREAVNQSGLMERKWLVPVLDTLMRALPYTYRDENASEGTTIAFEIVGGGGGDWVLLRQENEWKLYAGKTDTPAALVSMDQDLAWRLFTNEIDPKSAEAQVKIEGDHTLGAKILTMVSIMA